MIEHWRMVVKRLLDVFLATLTLLVLLPVFAVIAVLVKLSSKGPVIYRQERVGLNGKPFILLKFRTMVVDAEEVTGPVMSPADDKRVTPVGRVLRRCRLDELPQLGDS